MHLRIGVRGPYEDNISFDAGISAPKELREDVVVTSKTAYIRFHGKEEWYNYYYSEEK